jgi:hypothetical protein
MRSSLFLFVFFFACGPDVSAWKGVWVGSAIVNTGRAPEGYSGTLTIADGAKFQVTSDASGNPKQSFNCAINASAIDSSTATFTGPVDCDLVATPTGACTYKVTVNSGTATRNGNSIEGTINGRLASTCTVGSNKAEDFSLMITGTKK